MTPYLFIAYLFIAILTVGSLLNALLTQAIKRFYYNAGKSPSPNAISAINAFICGGGLTITVYLISGIPFNALSILSIVWIIILSWIGAMIGYDKVIQTIKQLNNTAALDKKNK